MTSPSAHPCPFPAWLGPASPPCPLSCLASFVCLLPLCSVFVSAVFCVSPLSPLACPSPPLFRGPSSSRVWEKTPRKAAGLSFPHPPHPILSSLPLPSGSVLSPPARLLPPRAWLRGVCVEDPEKAQCAPGAEHSNLSWARCHPEDSWKAKQIQQGEAVALSHRTMITSLWLAVDKVTCSVAGPP